MLVENIHRLCKSNNTTFWAVEKELKIGNGTIAKWSKSSPRVETVQKVAEYFGVTIDELLSGMKGGG